MTQTKLPPNQGQQLAADGFFKLLLSDEREMLISGPGGVGKTFLMGHLIDDTMPNYLNTCQLMGIRPLYDGVVMTATTNKAAEVLSRSTGRPTQTTHSFFNLKVKENYSTGRSEIIKSSGWKVHTNKIIFIDECSMIDRDLLKHIREGTQNCKIVYTGDHCQMAPIFEPISPIYKENLPFFELTEPMRTSDPHLRAINLQLRNTVETGVFNPIQVVPGVIDWLDSDQMQERLDREFLQDDPNKRILAYTNPRVVDYVTYIRQMRQITVPYVKGETLINNSAIQLPDTMLSVEDEITILDLDNDIVHVPVEGDVTLACASATIMTSFGETHTEVLLPLDRDHFNSLLAYYRKAKNWYKYYGLKARFPDLRQRDASTVYKAQGSTFGDVYIDMGNISTCHNPNQAARMLYVAFSRAKHRVFMFGDLSLKYGGIVR